VVGDERRGGRQREVGDGAREVPPVEPALDTAALEGVAGGEDDGVRHDLQRDGAPEVVRPRLHSWRQDPRRRRVQRQGGNAMEWEACGSREEDEEEVGGRKQVAVGARVRAPPGECKCALPFTRVSCLSLLNASFVF
jgi:hypothetical protein